MLLFLKKLKNISISLYKLKKSHFMAVAVDVAVARYTKYLYWSQQGDQRSLAILIDQGNLARAKAITREDTLRNLLEAVDSTSTFLRELERPIEDYDESELLKCIILYTFI